MYCEYFMVVALLAYNVAGSPLHGRCLSNEDCGTIDTYCKNEVCVCKPNFAVWYDSCVQRWDPLERMETVFRHYILLITRITLLLLGLLTI